MSLVMSCHWKCCVTGSVMSSAMSCHIVLKITAAYLQQCDVTRTTIIMIVSPARWYMSRADCGITGQSLLTFKSEQGRVSTYSEFFVLHPNLHFEWLHQRLKQHRHRAWENNTARAWENNTARAWENNTARAWENNTDIGHERTTQLGHERTTQLGHERTTQLGHERTTQT